MVTISAIQILSMTGGRAVSFWPRRSYPMSLEAVSGNILSWDFQMATITDIPLGKHGKNNMIRGQNLSFTDFVPVLECISDKNKRQNHGASNVPWINFKLPAYPYHYIKGSAAYPP